MAEDAIRQVADGSRPTPPGAPPSVAQLKAEIRETRTRIATTIDLTRARLPSMLGGTPPAAGSDRGPLGMVETAGMAIGALFRARTAFASVRSQPAARLAMVAGAVVGVMMLASARRARPR
jgi:hypothetical protein